MIDLQTFQYEFSSFSNNPFRLRSSILRMIKMSESKNGKHIFPQDYNIYIAYKGKDSLDVFHLDKNDNSIFYLGQDDFWHYLGVSHNHFAVIKYFDIILENIENYINNPFYLIEQKEKTYVYERGYAGEYPDIDYLKAYNIEHAIKICENKLGNSVNCDFKIDKNIASFGDSNYGELIYEVELIEKQ